MAPFFSRRLAFTMGGCFLVGAGIELFMIKTGFCERATTRAHACDCDAHTRFKLTWLHAALRHPPCTQIKLSRRRRPSATLSALNSTVRWCDEQKIRRKCERSASVYAGGWASTQPRDHGSCTSQSKCERTGGHGALQQAKKMSGGIGCDAQRLTDELFRWAQPQPAGRQTCFCTHEVLTSE